MSISLPKIKFKNPAYLVGGYVRDTFINPFNNKSKDIDVCMVCESFEEMEQDIIQAGGLIYLSKPEYLTIRCKIPELGDVDVALARTDGDYSDGRRPDSTAIAKSIEEDLARRDATMNAIAVDIKSGEVIDPFGGIQHIKRSVIRSVGDAKTRVEEDYLRLLRYIRFSITLSFSTSSDIDDLARNDKIVDGLIKNVSEERIREELAKCFKFSTSTTLNEIGGRNYLFYRIFSGTNIRLMPTTKEKFK
jgi:tRNA nucleotidyltransferase (CCA-adding enzyme)